MIAWLEEKGIELHNIEISTFDGSGRGVMSKTSFSENDIIFSCPEDVLITCSTALNSDIGPIIEHEYCQTGELKPMDVLILFLLRQLELADDSKWCEYIKSLPTKYYTVLSCSSSQISRIPSRFQTEINQCFTDFDMCFARISKIVSKTKLFGDFEPRICLPSIKGKELHERVKWGFETVQTRGCYWPKSSSKLVSYEAYCLIPVGDMFNFAVDDSKCGWEQQLGLYTFRAGQSYDKHEQLFICYAKKGNWDLFKIYGFALPTNDLDTWPLNFECTVKQLVQRFLTKLNKDPELGEGQAKEIISVLKREGYSSELCIEWVESKLTDSFISIKQIDIFNSSLGPTGKQGWVSFTLELVAKTNISAKDISRRQFEKIAYPSDDDEKDFWESEDSIILLQVLRELIIEEMKELCSHIPQSISNSRLLKRKQLLDGTWEDDSMAILDIDVMLLGWRSLLQSAIFAIESST